MELVKCGRMRDLLARDLDPAAPPQPLPRALMRRAHSGEVRGAAQRGEAGLAGPTDCRIARGDDRPDLLDYGGAGDKSNRGATGDRACLAMHLARLVIAGDTRADGGDDRYVGLPRPCRHQQQVGLDRIAADDGQVLVPIRRVSLDVAVSNTAVERRPDLDLAGP